VDTVVCPGCGEENPAKFRLCGFCGTSLASVAETVTCPSCGEENPGRFRLCGFCGTALGGPATGASAGPGAPAAPAAPAASAAPATSAAPAAQPAPVAPLPSQEVRKLVTLVFSDLKDSTALTASIDAEAMNEIKARYFGAMAVEIERHGGKVEKNIGDAIMAVFGLVRAHEDDALRAVRAAAGMKDTLTRLNDELQRFYGVTLTNRTGVNTGEIVANTDPNATQNLATGDAVNVAARLEQNAPANEILMGEMTYELVRGHVDVESLELQLKGKAEPVTAFRLVGLRSQPTAGATEESPFIGREFELDILNGAFAEATGTREARLVTVIGDAGVGKTRLIADFLGRVVAQATILRGRCLAYGDGITFWPLLEVVRAAARIGEDDSAEVARGKIAALVPSADPDREAVVDRVTSVVGLSPAAFPVAELFWGARKLLEAEAARRPLVLVVDDIHWAETTFLEFLEHVVTTVRDVPILVLCSARPELLDEHVGWTEQAHAERIDLQPLGAGEVEVMIDRLLGDAELSAETREKVISAADGNPLYVEQMVSMLREHGSDGGVIVVPPTISALIAARLDNLTREERAIVEPASVIGLVFPGEAIEELVPDLIRPTVTGHLSDLDRKQFVHPVAGGEDPAFRFHHILVRDAAYQSLLKRARASLHERFVDWAERVNRERDREIEFEEILGYHLEQAVRYRSELGPLDAAGLVLADRAATKLASAGRRAFSRGDTPAACNLLRRAAALLPTEAPTRIELLTELADALMEEGGFDQAGAVLGEALEIATRLHDERLEARAILGRRTLELSVGAGISTVLADAGKAIRAFEAAKDEAGLARAWRLLMLLHGTAGAYDDAAAAAKRVVEHARAAGDARLATRGAIGYAVSALHGPTPAGEALRRGEELVAEVSGDRKAEAVINGVLAQLHAMHGDFVRGRELYLRARAMLDDLGPSVTAASTSIEASRVEILAGNLAAAEALLRRDHDALVALGEQYYLSTVDAILAVVLEQLDQLDEAEEMSHSAEALADADDVYSQVVWRSARARVYVRRGRAEEAETLARAAVELAARTVDLWLLADANADLGEILQAIPARAADASAALLTAAELYERKGDLVSARRARELIGDAIPT
jgi:class 3 adenylate cyclase/tetratricopeptide (TPR) repeat protein